MRILGNWQTNISPNPELRTPNLRKCGGMAEWLKAAVLKTASRFTGRGFKSYSLRHPTLKLRMAGHPIQPTKLHAKHRWLLKLRMASHRKTRARSSDG